MRPIGPILCLALFGATVMGRRSSRQLLPVGTFSCRNRGISIAGWLAHADVQEKSSGIRNMTSSKTRPYLLSER